MKKIIIYLLTGLFCLIHSPRMLYGQFYESYRPRPQATLGGSAALFRISLDDFTDLYSSRLGPSWGAFAGGRVYSGYYLTFKYRTFQKSGKDEINPELGLNYKNAKWDEKWYTIGLRVRPTPSTRFSSYYGFGVVLYDINENPEISVFKVNNQKKEEGLGSGFFLEIGLEYYLMQKMATFFELEIASGGVRGKTGFEGFSVGGFRFALGISIFPF
jgi:hypothetical protein